MKGKGTCYPNGCTVRTLLQESFDRFSTPGAAVFQRSSRRQQPRQEYNDTFPGGGWRHQPFSHPFGRSCHCHRPAKEPIPIRSPSLHCSEGALFIASMPCLPSPDGCEWLMPPPPSGIHDGRPAGQPVSTAACRRPFDDSVYSTGDPCWLAAVDSL